LLPHTLCRPNGLAPSGEVVPSYLGLRDEPWLRMLIAEHARFVGRRSSELRARLAEPGVIRAPRAKLLLALRVLEASMKAPPQVAVLPRVARALVLRTAAVADQPRRTVLEKAAESLNVTPDAVEAALFADFPGERRVAPLPDDLSPTRLLLEANTRLLRVLFGRAVKLRVTAWGETRALVHEARQLGLICTASRPEGEQSEGVALDISGPFSLFRHTRLYRHALGSLVARAAACSVFEIRADCELRRGSAPSTVIVRTGDPITSSPAFKATHRSIQDRLARDLRRLVPDWHVSHEPEPFERSGFLFFPDLEIRSPRLPEQRWFVEIAGYWTRSHLETRLRRVQNAAGERFVLCVDTARGCAGDDVPEHAAILGFRRRIDARALLFVLSGEPLGETAPIT